MIRENLKQYKIIKSRDVSAGHIYKRKSDGLCYQVKHINYTYADIPEEIFFHGFVIGRHENLRNHFENDGPFIFVYK